MLGPALRGPSNPSVTSMKTLRTTLLPALVASLAVCSLHAQTVTGIFVGKSTEFVQTDTSTVAVNPAPTGPTYGGPFGFTASVEGTGLSAPTVTLPAGSQIVTTYPSSHNGGVLGFNSDENEWQYGSPNFNNWGTTTGAERNSLFANGDYTFSIPSFSDVTLSLNVPGTPIAAPPVFTLTGGAWTGGVYEINTSQTLTITSNTFTSFDDNANGHIFFGVLDKSGGTLVEIERLFSDDPDADNFIDYEIDANTLTAGHDYLVVAGFAAIVDQDTTIAGSMSVAFFELSTELTVSAIPEPSTYAALAGLGALSLAFWHRRHCKTA